MEKKIKLQELGELLQTPKNIVIIPHQNPDGDAIGSTLDAHLAQQIRKQ